MSESPTEDPGAGPSVSRNFMRGIEDMVEQNDNNFDGVINNLPEEKPVAQMTSADVIEEEQFALAKREYQHNMGRFIYWVKRCLRGKSRLCKSFCVTCPYYEQCRGDSDMQ